MVKSVVQDPNPILHKKTPPVTKFNSDEFKKLIKDMKDTLAKEDGLGLAAPQIGESLNVFVIPDDIAPVAKSRAILSPIIKPEKRTVFVNPEIRFCSKSTEVLEEGCLSVKGIYRETPRSFKVKLKARDERGHKFSVSAEGLLARIFQHETDHLNGILFIERL